eukprot:3663663-Pyramimonas_sp.AAC.1
MHARTCGPASAHALGLRPPPRRPDLLKTFTHKSPSRIKIWWTCELPLSKPASDREKQYIRKHSVHERSAYNSLKLGVTSLLESTAKLSAPFSPGIVPNAKREGEERARQAVATTQDDTRGGGGEFL